MTVTIRVLQNSFFTEPLTRTTTISYGLEFRKLWQEARVLWPQ